MVTGKGWIPPQPEAVGYGKHPATSFFSIITQPSPEGKNFPSGDDVFPKRLVQRSRTFYPKVCSKKIFSPIPTSTKPPGHLSPVAQQQSEAAAQAGKPMTQHTKVVRPMTQAATLMFTPIRAKLTPTAKASMLVATDCIAAPASRKLPCRWGRIPVPAAP